MCEAIVRFFLAGALLRLSQETETSYNYLSGRKAEVEKEIFDNPKALGRWTDPSALIKKADKFRLAADKAFYLSFHAKSLAEEAWPP